MFKQQILSLTKRNVGTQFYAVLSVCTVLSSVLGAHNLLPYEPYLHEISNISLNPC